MILATLEQAQLAKDLSLLYLKYELDTEKSNSEPFRTIEDVCYMYKKTYDEFLEEIVIP